jgi:hypothetical protein
MADPTLDPVQLAEIAAMFDRTLAQLDDLHREMQDCIATCDRIITTAEQHQRWREEHVCARTASS